MPKEYRHYITIDGAATGEVDFSELHPRLLYHVASLPVPERDLYDIGIVPFDDPAYPETRKIVKRYLNALLNDEGARYRLPPELLARLGVPNKVLRAKLLARHPIIREYLGTGVGLRLQYIDSQVTERILLECMRLELVVLPIHDSYICVRHRIGELIDVMRKAYTVALGEPPLLKPVEPFASDYTLPFTPAGEVDRIAMFRMHEESVHNQFVASWRATVAGGE